MIKELTIDQRKLCCITDVDQIGQPKRFQIGQILIFLVHLISVQKRKLMVNGYLKNTDSRRYAQVKHFLALVF